MATESLNYSNIPVAPFSENIEKLAGLEKSPEETLTSFQTLLSKYRMMEMSLKNKKDRFEGVMLELDTSLDAVERLKQPGDIQYDFELGSTLYAKATIPEKNRSVGLWLGAGVMIEQEINEAQQFLSLKKKDKQEEINKTDHDLDFIRRQITTMEVNIARLYNHTLSRSKPAKLS